MRIIAAFPGTGRLAYVAKYPNVVYYNPQLYPWDPKKHASELVLRDVVARQASKNGTCLVTAHRRNLRMLDKLQLNYALVVPDPSLKEAYLARYLAAPAPEGGERFANYMTLTWDYWLHDLAKRAHPRVTITLAQGETIADRLPFHQDPDYLETYQGWDNTDPCSVG